MCCLRCFPHFPLFCSLHAFFNLVSCDPSSTGGNKHRNCQKCRQCHSSRGSKNYRGDSFRAWSPGKLLLVLFHSHRGKCFHVTTWTVSLEFPFGETSERSIVHVFVSVSGNSHKFSFECSCLPFASEVVLSVWSNIFETIAQWQGFVELYDVSVEHFSESLLKKYCDTYLSSVMWPQISCGA